MHLANWKPHLKVLRNQTRYMGTVYLPALEAIASCGYNSVWDQDTHTDFPITRCLTWHQFLAKNLAWVHQYQYQSEILRIWVRCAGQVYGVLPHRGWVGADYGGDFIEKVATHLYNVHCTLYSGSVLALCGQWSNFCLEGFPGYLLPRLSSTLASTRAQYFPGTTGSFQKSFKSFVIR